MGSLNLEIALIFVLILANGLFSMAEMAVVSSRKARLKQRALEGSRRARVALALADNPNNFLSTVQIGITMIGTLAGAFGGATVAERLAAYLKQFPQAAKHSESISISVVVFLIGFLTLVLGELVPKALALGHAESIACALAPLMKALSKLGSPLVRLLTFSTEIVLHVLPIRKSTEAPVTEDEINVLVAQGAEHGEFAEAEREMVSKVFRLADRKVVELMRPRQKIHWLDVNEPWHVHVREIDASHHSRLLVADGELDNLLGIVHVKEILLALRENQVDLRALAQRVLVVPESTPALRMLERFQETGQQLAVVVDEHATIQGVVSPSDLMEAVMGEMKAADNEEARPKVTTREDGKSWLVDGALPYSDLLDELGIRELPLKDDSFTTVGGLVLSQLHRIPAAGDSFALGGYQFEVLDMDGNRIDKVMVQAI